MILRAFCTTCIRDGAAGRDPAGGDDRVSIELGDHLVYPYVCDRGHPGVARLYAPRFAVLFDLGACALGDGYYREAVANFSTSIERFYEFWVRTMWRNQGVFTGALEEGWKRIAAQSERQLGAFVGIYTSRFGRSPDLLSRAQTEFRNDVIHKGRFPSRSQALKFGQAILELIAKQVEELRDETGADLFRWIGEEVEREARDRASDLQGPASNLLAGIIIAINRDPVVLGTLESELLRPKIIWTEGLKGTGD